MTAKASIIIPVYNSEKYIRNCIESIIGQTYKNIEIICVNDGSTDSSGQIIEEYKEKNPNKIICIHQTNMGISGARNSGIEKASGKYLFFADNDDVMEKSYIEEFVSVSEETGCDMAIGGHKIADETGKIIRTEKLLKGSWSPFRFIMPWGRIYRKSFLEKHNLKFPATRLGEDAAINVPAAFKADKIIQTDICGYIWTLRRSSESNSAQKHLEKWPEAEKTIKFIYEKSDISKLSECQKAFLEYFIIKFSIRFLLYSGRHGGTLLNETADKAFKFIGELFPDFDKNRHLTIKGPEGESLFASSVIWAFIKMKKAGMLSGFLSIYGR